MRDDHQKLLRAMLDARRAFEEANKEQSRTWGDYLDAQAAFVGKFAETDYPLGPFVVGTTLIAHKHTDVRWPPAIEVFDYTDVIRCPTSE